ncbi:MAG: sulfite exporter TauE/SafE family protein [Alcaligenaceae bacterium]|nr:sulfite exporter TauE/SafE family protein [Alcaligenaceae bacterium]
MTLASLLGLLIGIVLGLTGAGGGILAVPALVLGMGFQMAQAAPIALIAVALASGLGAIAGLRRGIVRYRAALLMAAIGCLTSPLGLMAAHHIPNGWLMTIFSAVMVLVAYRMISGARRTGRQSQEAVEGKSCVLSPSTGRFLWTARSASVLAGIGAVAGLMTGMLGVGGGFVIVPALRHYSNVPMHGIVATSLMVIALVAARTVAGSIHTGVTLTPVTGAFIVCIVAGMFCGRLVARRVSGRALQYGFGSISALVAVLMLARAFLHLVP